jgi:hypothetical protein
MSDIALGFSLHGCLAGNEQSDRNGSKKRKDAPWLDNVEEHWVRHPLPYIKRIRTSKFSDPNWVEVLLGVRIPT